MDYDQMEKSYFDFLRLQGLHKLYYIFSKNKNELINLVKLNSILKNNDIKENQVICTITNANKLFELENELLRVETRLDQANNEYNHYTNENKNLRQRKIDLTKAVNKNENDLKTIEYVISHNNYELEKIKN